MLPASPIFAVEAKDKAQADTETVLDFHVYPAGVIVSIGQMWTVKKRHNLGAFIGWNYTSRGDFGKNPNEEGGGPGVSFLYQYHRGNIFMGVRADFWRMEIDWTNENLLAPEPQRGTTTIGVFQPTTELGYQWDFLAPLILRTSIAGGVEFNVFENGRSVGQGAIGLIRIALAYPWK